LEVECRPADDLEDIGDSGLLLPRVGEFASVRFELLFQIGVRRAHLTNARSRLRSCIERSLRPCVRLFAPLRDKIHLSGTSVDLGSQAEVALP
jgi:hypothetical protein